MKYVCSTLLVSTPKNFLVTNLCLQIFIIIKLIIFFIVFILSKCSICFRVFFVISLSCFYMNTVFQYQKNISYPSYNIRMPIFRITALCCIHVCVISHQSKSSFFLSLPFPSVSCSLLPFSSQSPCFLPSVPTAEYSECIRNIQLYLNTALLHSSISKGFSFLNSLMVFCHKSLCSSLLNIEPSLITFHLC